MYLSGTFVDSGSGMVSYSNVLFSAGSTNSVVTIPGTPVSSGSTVSNVQIDVIAPVFDNGGGLQQLDLLLTPQYFQFYVTSGSTVWNGDPLLLPSFTLDKFTPTEVDAGGNVQAGILNVSWIYDSLYGAGVSPYNTVTLQVYDGFGNLMGTTTTPTGTMGLNTASIAVVLKSTAITPNSQFNMTSRWASTAIIDTIAFYLPVF